MSTSLQPVELRFFATLATCGSLSAAARELGISTSAVSQRLSQMESRLGVLLINRTTRRMGVTPEGDVFLEHARRILAEIDDLDQLMTMSTRTPKGLLRVNATLGFGRLEVAPVISSFVKQFPGVEVQLQLSVSPPPLTEDQFDVCIRFGEPNDARVIAKRVARNKRLLCAAPRYLKAHGEPMIPQDLVKHNCITIRQGDEAYGLWRLSSGRGVKRVETAIKVRGNLATNDGEIAVNWALDGHGILMRAEWDVRRHLANGRLVRVLSAFETPDADIYAIYPQRHQLSTRVRSFVDYLTQALSHFPTVPPEAGGLKAKKPLARARH